MRQNVQETCFRRASRHWKWNKRCCLHPAWNMLVPTLEIFEDNWRCGFPPEMDFHFFRFSKAHNLEIWTWQTMNICVWTIHLKLTGSFWNLSNSSRCSSYVHGRFLCPSLVGSNLLLPHEQSFHHCSLLATAGINASFAAPKTSKCHAEAGRRTRDRNAKQAANQNRLEGCQPKQKIKTAQQHGRRLSWMTARSKKVPKTKFRALFF